MSRGIQFKSGERQLIDFEKIIDESHELGKKVYNKVQQGEDSALSKEYLAEFVPLAR